MNQEQLRENNIAQVIRTIRADDQCSRVSLAKTLGLKKSTITKIVNRLLDWELVLESHSMGNAKGRRPMRLVLNNDKYLMAVARVNRKTLHAALCNISGTILMRRERKLTQQDDARAAINALKEMLKDLIDRAPCPVYGIGMALPGPFDALNARVTLMTGFPGWEAINIHDEMREAFSLPLCLDHDTNCGALAELWFGTHPSPENMLYVTNDRGLGAALVNNGEINRGATGRLGEIGHASINIFGPLCECGNRGCLELYCSCQTLENEYQQALLEQGGFANGSTDYQTIEEICQRVREGDETARATYAKVVNYLAFGLVSVVNILNPGLIVFADKITLAGDYLLELVRPAMARNLMPDVFNQLDFGISSLHDDPVLLGAAVLGFEEMIRHPTLSFR